MTSPQIKILLVIAAVSTVYAYICNIRLSRSAQKLARRFEKERPDLWAGLSVFARNFNGGQPGLKLLYRRNAVDLAEFDRQFAELRAMERKSLLGLGIGLACIGLLVMGFRFWGWHW